MTRIIVRGTPATQGSKKHVGNGVMVESSKKTKPWRSDVSSAVADQHDGPRLDGPLQVSLTFVFDRPKGHWRTGRNAHLLRDAAPPFPAGKRDDLDKLARAVLDACTTGGLWHDDGQVVWLSCEKVYVGAQVPLDVPGCVIEVDPCVHDCGQALYDVAGGVSRCRECGRPMPALDDAEVRW